AVTDEMIDLVTIIGPVAECRRRLEELERAGVAEVAVGLRVPGGGQAELLAALEALAPAGAVAWRGAGWAWRALRRRPPSWSRRWRGASRIRQGDRRRRCWAGPHRTW